MLSSLYQRRSRRRSVSKEQGFSLVELLVAIMIFLILVVMISGMMISVVKTTTQTRSIDGDTRSAANAMNELSRVIRAATENPLLNPASGVYPNDAAVQAAGLRTVTLYTYVNLASSAEIPTKVMFSVNAQNQLVETKWPGTTVVSGHWTFSTTSTTRIICDNMVAGSTIFAYNIDDGTPIAVPAAGITSNSTLLSIRSISVSVSTKNPQSRAVGVSLQNTVGMPNLGFSNSTVATS
jgi:prepilin-type N-terminal cleavage/methylation domain-containing protein